MKQYVYLVQYDIVKVFKFKEDAEEFVKEKCKTGVKYVEPWFGTTYIIKKLVN